MSLRRDNWRLTTPTFTGKSPVWAFNGSRAKPVWIGEVVELHGVVVGDHTVGGNRPGPQTMTRLEKDDNVLIGIVEAERSPNAIAVTGDLTPGHGREQKNSAHQGLPAAIT